MTVAEIKVPLRTQNSLLDQAYARADQLDKKLRSLLGRKTTGGPERRRDRGEKIARVIEKIKLTEAEIDWLWARRRALRYGLRERLAA
jgi:hypothetical protein